MQSYGLSPAELEKIHAEIAKLIDDTIKRNAESREFNAEVGKLNTEFGKFTREIFWYPMAVVTGLYCVMAVIMTVIYKLLH
ncbi:hypothetical protein D3C76_1694910 [compost metagenome]